jgi:hypothetical protein
LIIGYFRALPAILFGSLVALGTKGLCSARKPEPNRERTRTGRNFRTPAKNWRTGPDFKRECLFRTQGAGGKCFHPVSGLSQVKAITAQSAIEPVGWLTNTTA